MSVIRDMKLFDAFNGDEINLFYKLLIKHLIILESKRNDNEDDDIRMALSFRIMKLQCLVEDIKFIWLEMNSDGNYDDIRSKKMFKD